MLSLGRVRGGIHQHTLPSAMSLSQCNLLDCLMKMNGPDCLKSTLSHFSVLNQVWRGRSPQAIKPDDVLRCQTACSRMRATTVGDGHAEHELIAPWRVPDGQFSGGDVSSYIGCPNMPERDP